MNREMMIGRRRFLMLTAAGVSVTAIGGFPRGAKAAETIRWVSPPLGRSGLFPARLYTDECW